MNDRRVVGWTRRRVGLAIGGVLAALAGLGGHGKTTAKHKHRHKRCGKQEIPCGRTCVKGTCCLGAPCGTKCFCGTTTEGTTACFAELLVKCESNCETSADCPEDARCLRGPCFDQVLQICTPLCGTIAG
jgi:hypothetical protein